MLENHMTLNTPDAPWNAKDDDGSDGLESLMNFMEDLPAWKRTGTKRSHTGMELEVRYTFGTWGLEVVVSRDGWEHLDGTKIIGQGETVEELKRSMDAADEEARNAAEDAAYETAQVERPRRIEQAAKDFLLAIDRGYFGSIADVTDSAFLAALREAIK